jgi:hypothetical protein
MAKYKLRIDWNFEAMDDAEMRPVIEMLLRALNAGVPAPPAALRLTREGKLGPLENAPENILTRPTWAELIPASLTPIPK